MRLNIAIVATPVSTVGGLVVGGADAQSGKVSATPSSDPLIASTQYHGGPTRSGHVARAPRSPLHQRWARALSGSVYGEPLVVGDTLIVATENNYVYGLNARTGTTRWRSVQLGAPARLSELPCGNIDPLGITSTPAYDAATGSVFVAAETAGAHHTLWALNAATGARRWHRTLDTQPNRDRYAQQQRSALLVTSGRVITTFGGLAGDCGNYGGYVVSVPTNGRGVSTNYSVPTAREGGIWATPGPVVGDRGNIYLSVGNGAAESGPTDRSDSVTELNPVTLRRIAMFAPTTWRQDNSLDLDLGSSSPAIVPAVDRVVAAGKRGTVYLLKPTLGGVGSNIASLDGCRGFGGAAVVGTTVVMPCREPNSIRALRVTKSGLSWAWTRNGIYGSPVIAGGYVFVADAVSGDLVVLGLARGGIHGRYHVGTLPHFPSEVVSGSWVFAPSLTGVTAFHGS